MYKIALMGNRDSLLGFQLLGCAIFEVVDKEEAVETLNNLVKEDYTIIFITEEIASQILNIIEELQKKPLISITIIPSQIERKNLGMNLLRRNVEKAIGTDIIFKKEGE